jgi:hypothetical protein
MIKLGSKCRDKITGFVGIAVCRSQYITGCDRYSLQSQKRDKDGKPCEWNQFDENQLEVMDDAAVELKPLVTPQASASVGGPRPSPGASNRDVARRR